MVELWALQIGCTSCPESEMFSDTDDKHSCSFSKSDCENCSHCSSSYIEGSDISELTPRPEALCQVRSKLPSALLATDFEELTSSEKRPDKGNTSQIDYACFAYLVRTSRRLILVDTGFGRDQLEKYVNCRAYRPIVEQLAKLDIKAEQITDVVITHAHWSNIGALQEFSKARFYISARELNAMERALTKGYNDNGAYREEDMRTIGALERLHIVKHGLAIDENLRVDVIGGHTRGFMMATVMFDGISRVMLAGDNAPMYRHLQGEDFPLDWCTCGTDVRERLKMRMHTAFVLPGRDPEILRRYSEFAPGIALVFKAERK